MIPKQTGRRRGSLARITANVEFSSSGDLKTILLNAENDGDQETRQGVTGIFAVCARFGSY